MKYYFIVLLCVLLLPNIVDSDSNKIAILEELHQINKQRIDLMQKDYKLLVNKLNDTRKMLKSGNDAKKILIEELESLNERYTNLETVYHKKILTNHTKNFFAFAGLPLGALVGWGIRDLGFYLHKK